jgi:hypothetical protein
MLEDDDDDDGIKAKKKTDGIVENGTRLIEAGKEYEKAQTVICERCVDGKKWGVGEYPMDDRC